MPITKREPSSGGIGMRLKTPSKTFIMIKFSKIKVIFAFKGANFNGILRIKASIKFASGPLKPTQIISLLGFFKAQ